MKKVWLALAGMILAFSASAAQITDGKQYTTGYAPFQFIGDVRSRAEKPDCAECG